MKTILLTSILIGCFTGLSAQEANLDTLPSKTLENVIINARLRASNASYLPDVSGTNIYAGKRTNSLLITDRTPGIPLNMARIALARIPGITMWEMDGAGTQLNMGSRGTDPHRSIEMNMRQNGYNTNSDQFGYPENHYTIPMQAIEEIQYVRGSSALQFGPQFGGMMNYRIKEGDSSKTFVLENEQTVGSNDLFNSYTAVGGTTGKINYYAFYDNRHGGGWRDNSRFNYHAYYAHLRYSFTEKMSLTAEFSRMDYIQQIAGGLTDDQFKSNPRQSVRSRNYFQPLINIAALKWQYSVSANTHLEITSHLLWGERNSVQFLNPGNIPDTVNTTIGSYNPRQVDRDYYSGFTTEARILHHYTLGNISSVVAGGLRYFTEVTKRKQKGKGTVGSDFDLTLTQPYGIDLHFDTHNYVAFVENIFQVSKRLSITPGMRYEIIRTDLGGVINNATDQVSYVGKRSFPLFGTGLQYDINSKSQVFANFSQAYRPYLYAAVTPADRVDQIDPNLKDSKGYNIDIGYRGQVKDWLQYDFSAFYLHYGNKIGLVTQDQPGGNPYLFTTNIGNSVAKGFEIFVEFSLLKFLKTENPNQDIRIFNSLAYDHARYTSGEITKGGVNTSIRGNRVENAPDWINKTGVRFKFKNISTSFQYSYTSVAYNDAFNTESSANGVVGKIPSYDVWDWSVDWQFSRLVHLSGAVNNFANKKYFNRRITMYPGPGILPADGRTFYISLGTKI